LNVCARQKRKYWRCQKAIAGFALAELVCAEHSTLRGYPGYPPGYKLETDPECAPLNQPLHLLRGAHEVREKRVRGEGFAFQLGVELDADEPGVVFDLDDLWQFAIRAHA
jgi:hypothetical protein